MKLDPISLMEVYNGKMAYHLTTEGKTFFKENGFLAGQDTVDSQVVAEAQDVLWSHMRPASDQVDRKAGNAD